MKKLLCVFLLLSTCICFGQRNDNVWIMGYDGPSGPPWGGIHFSFNGDTLNQSWFNVPIWLDNTNASICDTSGNLLFYTNGAVIINKNNDTLLNGDSLSPCQFTHDFGPYGLTTPQGALILPMPDNSNIYYLFHETMTYDGYADHILFSIIDMSLDGGKGGVTNKNMPLINDSMAGGLITSVRHANGRDWWVAIPTFGGDKIYIFLLSPDGITDVHAQTVGASNNHYLLNQAVFSPDGSIYARSEYIDGGFYVYDFDRCTGVFSNSRYIQQTPIKPGGLAISPNSKVLYVSAHDTIFQFDLTTGNIAGTQQIVAVYDSFASPFGSTFFQQELAPDGKIYISCGNAENVIHVIDYPDSLGLACHVCQHCVQLPAYLAWGLPNYPNFRLGALVGSPCDTLHIGVVEAPNLISGKIFPNPARDWIVFELAQILKENATLTIYNILGEQVLKQSLNAGQMRYSVNLSGIAEGMYIVKVSEAKGVLYNGKLVIQK